jgi:hypothetical protein
MVERVTRKARVWIKIRKPSPMVKLKIVVAVAVLLSVKFISIENYWSILFIEIEMTKLILECPNLENLKSYTNND